MAGPEFGAEEFVVDRVDVLNAVTQLVAPRQSRRHVVFVNHGAADVFIGDAAVATDTGFKLPPGASVTLATAKAVHGISEASQLDAVHVIDVFDE